MTLMQEKYVFLSVVLCEDFKMKDEKYIHLTTQTVRERLSKLMVEVDRDKKRVIITRFGKPVAAMVSLKELK